MVARVVVVDIVVVVVVLASVVVVVAMGAVAVVIVPVPERWSAQPTIRGKKTICDPAGRSARQLLLYADGSPQSKEPLADHGLADRRAQVPGQEAT